MPIVNYNHVNRQLRSVDFVLPSTKDKEFRKFCKKACQVLGGLIKKPTEIQAAFLATTFNKEDAEWGKSIGILAMLPDHFVYITVTEAADEIKTYTFPYAKTNNYTFVDNQASTGMASVNFTHDGQNFSFVAVNGLVPEYFIMQLGKIDLQQNPKNYGFLRKFFKGILNK